MEGNRMKMREALEELVKFACNSCERRLCEEDAEEEDGRRFPSFCSAIINARNALSAPARQCDVGMPVEQVVRFRDAMIHECLADEYCRCKDAARCFAQWAQTPYAEEGAGK